MQDAAMEEARKLLQWRGREKVVSVAGESERSDSWQADDRETVVSARARVKEKTTGKEKEMKREREINGRQGERDPWPVKRRRAIGRGTKRGRERAMGKEKDGSGHSTRVRVREKGAEK